MLAPIKPTRMRFMRPFLYTGNRPRNVLSSSFCQIADRSRADVLEDHFDDLVTPRRQRLGRAHVALEDGGEGGAIGDVEDAERADRHVQLDRVDAALEDSGLLTARHDAPDRVDHRDVELADRLRALHVHAVHDVLVHHETHELGVGVIVIEGRGDQRGERLLGRLVLQIERRLLPADRRVGGLQHREVEPLLAAEVVVDHALAGARAIGDRVDPSAAEATLRELHRGDLEDVALNALGIVLALLPHALPLTPASAKVAMPLWQAAAALRIGTASAAPEASPSRMSMSSNGRGPIVSSRRVWPGSPERCATLQWSSARRSAANSTAAAAVQA